MQTVWGKIGRRGRRLTDIPEEMKDHLLALIDSFAKQDWPKFDKALAGLTKSREEGMDEIE